MSTNKRDSASNQLVNWQKQHQNEKCYITNSDGIQIDKHDISMTVGPKGPIVFYDYNLFDQLSHFVRERIPERAVHARGTGAFGYFEVSGDITNITRAKLFEKIGKKTPIAVRFSQVAGNLGTPETVRDVRGFAIKFYTEDGIYDLVGNNTPIFFMRDPKLFPMFIHSQKRNPATNIMRDWDMFWDYLSLYDQSVHQILILFADRGIPNGYRHMNGYGSHTFSMINSDKKLTYIKFHYKTDQGIKNLDPSQADIIAGQDPDYLTRDLYNAITNKHYPSWTLYIQTMTIEQAKNCKFDPFDITKVWPKKDYPLKCVGKFILNRNPINHFAEIEQLAFSPSNFIPGIGPSPDRLLQGRLFSYNDAHRYRVGVNSDQLPINCPFKICNYERDGFATINNQGDAPNYHPNSFDGPNVNPQANDWTISLGYVSGDISYYDNSDQDNYSQARKFYSDVLNDNQRQQLINNLADSLKMTTETIRNRAVAILERVDKKFGCRLKKKLQTSLHAHL